MRYIQRVYFNKVQKPFELVIQATSTEQTILSSTDSSNALDVILGKQSTWAFLLWQKNRPLKILGQALFAIALRIYDKNKTSVQFWSALF